MKIINKAFISSFFKIRNDHSHKGDFGHAFLISGSCTKMGAALIASKACLRTGVGLLTVFISKEDRQTLNIFLPEAMIHLKEDKIDFSLYDVVGIGPGLSQNETVEKLVYATILEVKKNLVIDADALNLLAKNPDWLKKLPPNTILTPHPKEFDRLFGNHDSEQSQRNTAILKAKEINCIIVLKGHKTFITNGMDAFENTTGNAGLAKGGSGDALTGMITALLAQKYSAIEAALLGVYLHGLSADLTLKAQSTESMLITDVIENIGIAFKEIQI